MFFHVLDPSFTHGIQKDSHVWNVVLVPQMILWVSEVVEEEVHCFEVPNPDSALK